MPIKACGELDENTRKEMYRDMAMIVRDGDGVILPIFKDFIEAVRARVVRQVSNSNQEKSCGYAKSRCWLKA